MESDETSGEDSDYDYEESDEILPVDPPSSEESSEEDEDDKFMFQPMSFFMPNPQQKWSPPNVIRRIRPDDE